VSKYVNSPKYYVEYLYKDSLLTVKENVIVCPTKKV
jgi:hypothetical protein